MHTPLRQVVLDQSLQLITLAQPLVAVVLRRDRDLGAQLRRALSSVALNIAEGFGTGAGSARLRFETARGSLYEAQAALRVAVAWAYVDSGAVAPVIAAADALAGRLYGLARR